METAPEILGLLQDFFLGPYLNITDQFPGKMLKPQGANRRTGATVETLQRRVHAVRFELFSKIWID
jgi:hypothetical protein